MSPDPDLTGFVEIAHRVVWCTLATVDRRGRPRSRLVHPVWTLDGSGELTGYVCSRRTSPKSAHLEAHPYASCSYWDPAHDVAVADCHAGWDPEPARHWDVFRRPGPAAGFDPEPMFEGGLSSPEAGIIVLRPWRLRWGRAADLAGGKPQTVWTGAATPAQPTPDSAVPNPAAPGRTVTTPATAAGDLEAAKALAVRWLDLISAGDVDELCRTSAPTWTMVGGPPNLPAGPEGIRTLFGTFGEITQTWQIEDVIGEGDKVVVRAVNRCTQDSFLGIPGRGVEQVFTATFTFQIADGLVQRMWRNADDLGRMVQLGARILPPATG